jgi:hypothetical protein
MFGGPMSILLSLFCEKLVKLANMGHDQDDDREIGELPLSGELTCDITIRVEIYRLVGEGEG